MTNIVGQVGTEKLFENDRVIVWETRLRPGEKGDLHEHKHDYVIVVLEGDRVLGLTSLLRPRVRRTRSSANAWKGISTRASCSSSKREAWRRRSTWASNPSTRSPLSLRSESEGRVISLYDRAEKMSHTRWLPAA